MKTHEGEVKVWDPAVRIFHWSLVCFVLITFVTGDDFLGFHVLAGYAVLSLLLFRVVWGLIGPKYARFSEFLYPPRVVLNYLKNLITCRAKRYLGHGPAGGSMVITLMITLLLVCLSGLGVYGGEESAGPFAGFLAGAGHFWIEVLEEVHEFLAGLVVLLVGFHIGGVLLSSLAHGENLIKSMITGYKPEKTVEYPRLEEDVLDRRRRRKGRAMPGSLREHY